MISIIIPTCGKGDIVSCLKSIIEYTDISKVRVLVSANGCPDDIITTIEGLKCCELIINDEPIGFPKAVNVALKLVDNSDIVLLNDDLTFQGPWLHLFTDQLDKADILGDCMFQVGSWCANQLVRFDVISFYCAFIKWEAFKKIGFLDESYSPGYGEDANFCIRAMREGFKFLRVRIPLYHVGTQSLGASHDWNWTNRIADECVYMMVEEGYWNQWIWLCKSCISKPNFSIEWLWCPDCVTNYNRFRNAKKYNLLYK